MTEKVLIKDRYQIEETLGKGGMAIVYKGTGKDGKDYAIKVIY